MWSTAFGVTSVFMMPLMSPAQEDGEDFEGDGLWIGLSDGGVIQTVFHQAAEPPLLRSGHTHLATLRGAKGTRLSGA
jgi:hypothetical protein